MSCEILARTPKFQSATGGISASNTNVFDLVLVPDRNIVLPDEIVARPSLPLDDLANNTRSALV